MFLELGRDCTDMFDMLSEGGIKDENVSQIDMNLPKYCIVSIPEPEWHC